MVWNIQLRLLNVWSFDVMAVTAKEETEDAN